MTKTTPVTIKQCLLLAQDLQDVSDTARLDVEVLLCEALNVSRSYLYTWPEKLLDHSAENNFYEFFSRRKHGEPIAYIVGKKEFWSREFIVNPSTLIPRADTESLVEYVLSFFDDSLNEVQDKRADDCKCILDLGTGTGALAITLALELKNIVVDAVDFSKEAVQLAQKNAFNLKADNVNVFVSDWFECVERKKYDVIVSNPPYIDEKDPHLNQGDVRFEPLSALIAMDYGLGDIDQIARNAVQYLKSGASLIVEHGFMQGEDVRRIFRDYGFTTVSTQKDLADRDRFTVGTYLSV